MGVKMGGALISKCIEFQYKITLKLPKNSPILLLDWTLIEKGRKKVNFEFRLCYKSGGALIWGWALFRRYTVYQVQITKNKHYKTDQMSQNEHRLFKEDKTVVSIQNYLVHLEFFIICCSRFFYEQIS